MRLNIYSGYYSPPIASQGENLEEEDTDGDGDGLSRYTKVTYGTLEDIPDYQSKPYLILLGRPSTEDGTLGKIIYDLTPEEYLERMMVPGSHWMEACE